MKKGDFVLYYHSGEAKEIVGLAKVEKEAYPDPTAEEGDWSVVDLKPVKALHRPVGLPILKSDKALREMPLVKQSRLSVSPLTADQFQRILSLAETKP
jgi:predicted RNA-binding protein with PUA-like domain